MPIGKNKYEWNRVFRQRILALCLDSEWYARFGISVIRPEYFEMDEETMVAEAIVSFYRKYRRVPDDDELYSLIETSSDAVELLDEIYDIIDSDEELDYARDQAVQFAKEQAMKLAILDSVDDIEKGLLSSPLARVKDALHVGTDLLDIGMSLMKDTEWAYEEALGEKVQTGIYHLDMMLDGGLANGELGLLMAATNVGKTMGLVNIGYGAASLLSASNVVHISCELSEQKVAKRYAARTTFGWIERGSNPAEYLVSFEKAAKQRLRGNVRIKEFPSGTATVEDIDAYLERLEIMGEKCDLLIVDYPDEMKHMTSGEPRFVLADTLRQLRALAMTRNIPVWGATQANRSALSKEIVTVGDISESYQKAQVSDVIIAMCQTQVEQDDNIMRLFAAKVRDGLKGWMVRCMLNPTSHALVSYDVITIAEMIEENRKRKADE